MGIEHLLGMKINIDWERQGYEGVLESTIKKYNANDPHPVSSSLHGRTRQAKQNRARQSALD